MPSAKQSEIKIVPIGDVDDELLEYLTLTLPGILNATCVLLTETLDPRPSYRRAPSVPFNESARPFGKVQPQ